MADALNDALEIAGYGVIGLVLMVAGYAVVDVLTPGKLSALIFQQRNRNAAIVTASSVGAMAIVAAMSVHSAEGDASDGLAAAAVYGVVGLVLMAVSFLVIDLLTPGKLGDIVTDPQPQPATWVTATAHLGVGLVIAAAIS
ncbi:MAG: DUF350 domain-containing protein [Acidimicrobiia bacterium]